MIKEMAIEKADIMELQRCTDELGMLQTEVTRIRDNCGEFLWCIGNWEDKRKRLWKGIDKFICSDPFYSHRNGYKMRLRVEFYNSRLYLYLQILRGEFDNILQWPFWHEVKLDLMNQETGLHCTNWTLKAAGDPNDERRKKPITGENEGSGFYYGFDLPDLSLNPALLKGSQICIRAIPKINP